jgi:hypothetical protein
MTDLQLVTAPAAHLALDLVLPSAVRESFQGFNYLEFVLRHEESGRVVETYLRPEGDPEDGRMTGIVRQGLEPGTWSVTFAEEGYREFTCRVSLGPEHLGRAEILVEPE